MKSFDNWKILLSGIFVALLMLVTAPSIAQFVPVGNPSGDISTSTTYPSPYGNFYWGSRQQFLYPASELNAAGLVAGPITAIQFDVIDTDAAQPHEDYQISIAQTATASLAGWESGLTPVYGPTTQTPTVGLNTFTFSSAFVWDGTSNIVIEICHSNSSFTDNCHVEWTTPLGYTGSYTYRADGSFVTDGGCATTLDSQTAFGVNPDRRPMTEFEGTLAACTPLNALAESNVTATSADISFANILGDVYIEYGTAGFTPGTDENAGGGTIVGPFTTSPQGISGLTGTTTYDVYVRQDCGSEWSPNAFLSFATSCTTYGAPYAEGFEGLTPTTNATWPSTDCITAVPENTTADYRWNQSSAGTTSGGTGPLGPHEGSVYAFTEATSGGTGAIATLDLGPVDLSSLTTPVLSFYYHMFADGFPDMGTLNAQVSTDGISWNTEFTVSGQQQAAQGDAFLEAIVPLAGYTGQTVFIRFESVRGTGFRSDMAIDDINVEEAPSCLTPLGLTAQTTSTTAADVSWACAGCTGDFYVEYGAPGFVPGAGATAGGGTVVGPIAGTSTTIFPLTADTDYDIYVRQDCGVDGFSGNSASASIFTGYCEGGPTSAIDSNLGEVSASGLGGSSFSFDHCAPPNGPDIGFIGTEDQTALSIDVADGFGGDITVEVAACDGSTFTNQHEVWVDWNNNLTFEPGESIGSGSGNPVTETYSIVPPPGTPVGTYRMRVMLQETATVPPLDPCASYSWGSMTDFSVNVVTPPACTQPTASFNLLPDCGGGEFSIEVIVSDAGSSTGSLVDITNDGGQPALTGVAPGTYVIGPFTAGPDVSVTVVNLDDPLCNLVSPATGTDCVLCSGGPTSTVDSNIELVEIDGFAGSGFSHAGCPGVAGVEDLTALSVDIPNNFSYDVTVDMGTCGGFFAGAGAVWVDWNGDFAFSAAEVVGTSATNPSSNIFTLTPPPGTTVGPKIMRVMQQEGGALPLDPCATFTWGSVMDFTVNVIADPGCLPVEADLTVDVSSCVGASAEYFINVDITSAGDSPGGEVTISNSFNSNTISNATVAGSPYVYGPFPSGTDLDVTLAHLGNTLCSFSAGFDYTCPPENDNCADVTPTTLVSGVTSTFTGTTAGANESAPFTGASSVWVGFEVTGSCNNVTIEFCGNTPEFVDLFPSLAPTCTAVAGDLILNDGFFGGLCGDGDGNPTLFFNDLPAGTYYYAIAGDTPSNVPGPYSIDITSEDCPPPPTASCDPEFSTSPGSFITTGSPVSSVVTVGPQVGGSVITDMDVAVNITHSFVSDLTIELTSPCGTTVVLQDAVCGVEDNMEALYNDDAATTTFTEFCISRSGPVVPLEALSAFNDELIEGDWTLTVTDNFGGDDGNLVQWCLVPTLDDVCLPPLIEVTAFTDETITVDLGSGGCFDPGSYNNFDIQWTGGGSASGVSLPYQLTGLTPGTEYFIDVTGNCASGSSIQSGVSQFTLNCDPVDVCTYDLTLTNTSGNGFGGGVVSIFNGWESSNYIMDADVSTQTWEVLACSANSISLFMTAAPTPSGGPNFQISLTNSDGIEVFGESGVDASTNYFQAEGCPTCSPVANLQFTRLAADLVEVSWTNVALTPNVDDITVEVTDFVNPIGSVTVPAGSTSASVPLGASYPGQGVQVNVHTNCSNLSVGTTSGFPTLPSCDAVDQCEYQFNLGSTGDGWGDFGLEAVLTSGFTPATIDVGLESGTSGTQSIFACPGDDLSITAISSGGSPSGCLAAANGQWPFAALTPVCGGAPAEQTDAWTDEYSLVNTTAGNLYTFSSTDNGGGAANFVTVSNSAGTVVLAAGESPVSWYAQSSGSVRFYSHNSDACDGDTDSFRTRSVSCASAPAPITCDAATFDLVFNPASDNIDFISNTDFCDLANGDEVFSGTTCPSCLPALDVSVDNIGVDIADVSWTSNNPGGTDYTVHIGTPGFTPGGPGEVAAVSGTTVASGPQGPVSTGAVLSGSTDYEAIIVEDCGGGETSESVAAAFTTEQAGGTCGAAIAVDCSTGTIAGNTSGIPNDNVTSGAPTCVTTVGTGGQIWYAFTPATNNTATLDVCVAAFDTKIHVYNGTCGALTCVTGNDDFCGLQSSVTFDALAGVTYLVRVGGFGADEGAFDLNISCGPAINCFSPTVSANVACVGAGFDVVFDISNDGTAANYDVSYTVNGGTPVSAGNFAAGSTGNNLGANFTFGDLVDVTVSDPAFPAECVVLVEDVTTLSGTCPPANDNCSSAQPLTVNGDEACGSVTAGTIANATPSGDANPCGGTADDDVWFSFVATSGQHTVDLLNITNGTTDLYHAVYSGTCGSLVNLNCSDPNSSVVSGLTIGDTYYVRVYSWTGTAGQTSEFDICIGTPPPPPANDNCSSAEPLTVNGDESCGTVTAGTIGSATPSADANPCGGTADDDVWFSFVATSGQHTVDLLNITNGTTDLYHAVYSGTCGSLVNLTCSDPNSSEVSGLTIGDTYYVRVYSWTATPDQTSEFDICIGTPPPPPANDLCGDAIPVGCNSSTSGTTINATTTGAPATCVTTLGSAGGVWYTVTGVDGTMFASLCGAGFDTNIGVFTGACGGLTCVTGNDDDNGTGGAGVCGGGLQSSTSWASTDGTTYYIYVTGFGSATGNFTLDVDCYPIPDNNLCDDAQSLSPVVYPNNSFTLGTLTSATVDGAAACIGTNGPDVFYSLNVPIENHYWVNVNPIGGFNPVIEVLDACNGSVVACGNTQSLFVQNLTAGDYVIRVYNFDGSATVANDGVFLIGVQSFPTAKVQDFPGNVLYACNQGGFQLEDFVGATPQTGQLSGILDYEWLVAEQGGTEEIVWQRGAPNYAARIDWLGMEYNTTYNVYVRIQLNVPGVGPVWGVHQVDGPDANVDGAQECTISTSSNITLTEVLPAYQGSNVDGDPYALCDFVVAYNVFSADNFRWRFDTDLDPNSGNEIFYVRGTGNPSIRLSWVDGLQPGVPYNVSVAASVDGNWAPYGTARSIPLAGVPNVAVRPVYCGGTYAPTDFLLAESVCEADFYRFRFTPQFAGATRQKTAGSYALALGTMNPPLAPGTYNVQVQVQQGGVLGDYSPTIVANACEITISAAPGLPGGEAPVAQRSETFGNATLFPNPNAGSEVRMELDGLSDGNHEVMIQVYDVYGKLIQTDGFGHEGDRLSRLVRFENELAMGVYMLHIVVDGERFATERLIVK